jgi:hypothetical protein
LREGYGLGYLTDVFCPHIEFFSFAEKLVLGWGREDLQGKSDGGLGWIFALLGRHFHRNFSVARWDFSERILSNGGEIFLRREQNSR